MNMVAQIWIYR